MKSTPQFTDPVVSREIREAEDWLKDNAACMVEHNRLIGEINAQRQEMIARGIPKRAALGIMVGLHVEVMAQAITKHPEPMLYTEVIMDALAKRVFALSTGPDGEALIILDGLRP